MTNTASVSALGARVARRALIPLIGGLLLVVGMASAASASHFRYGQYAWAPAGGNKVDFQVQNAFRRSGFGCIEPSTGASKTCSQPDSRPGVGDYIRESIGATNFNFGDGTFSPPGGGELIYKVTAFDPTADFIFGQAIDSAKLPTISTTISHTYAAAGNKIAFSDSSARIGNLMNNANGSYRIETLVNVGGTNRPPATNLPPIVDCPRESLCTFKVPASDPDGDPIRWRFSTASEAGSGFVQPSTPTGNNAAVNATNGTYTWDTHGARVATSGDTLYSSQVSIEDVTSAGAVKSKVAVDFLIRLVSTVTPPPTFVSPSPACNSTIKGTVGLPIGFTMKATHPTSTTQVTLNATGLPIGATMTPSLPTTGNPVQSTFSWKPTAAGSFVTNFTASTATGQSALCSITIAVDAAKPLTTTKVASVSSVTPGAQVGYTITVTNPNNGAVTASSITDTLPAGFTYVAGSTTGVTSANPTISGQSLTWPGAFVVPANSSISLSFKANASATPGTYTNNAGGTSSTAGFTVTPTGPTAPVTVRSITSTVAKTADAGTSNPSSANGYTITITNGSSASVTYSHITDSLPTGFVYKVGSTTGATTANPTITTVNGAQVLDWAGSFVAAAGGTVKLHFGVTTSSVSGDYLNEAKAISGTTTFTSGKTALVKVRKPLVASKTAAAPAVPAGANASYTIKVTNPNADAATLTSLSDTLPAGFTYKAGSTTGLTTANPTIAGQKLTWTGSFSIAANGAALLSFTTVATSIPGTYLNTVEGASSVGVVGSGPTAPVVVNGPLTTTKTAKLTRVAISASDGYTITIKNPNAGPVRVDSITDSLPAGFTYTAGSTTGATTANPAISGQNLTWPGPFTVPGAGALTLSFGVTVSGTPGDYFNSAGGTSTAANVVGSGATAKITVIGPVTTQKTADAPTVIAGGIDGYTIRLTNPNTVSIAMSVTDNLPADFTYRSGSTTGLTTANPTITGVSALRWDGITLPPTSVTTLHFSVKASSKAGVYYNNAGGTSADAPITPTGNTAPITVREQTVLTAHPAVLEAHMLGGQVYLKLSATLVTAGTNTPLPGRTIQFSIDGAPACSAVTDANGLAQCDNLPDALLHVVGSVVAGGYDASFAAETLYLGSTSHGPNVVIAGERVL